MRSTVAALVAAGTIVMGGSIAAAPADAAATHTGSATPSISRAKYYFNTWETTRSATISTDGRTLASINGWLYPGRNYFYCQAQWEKYTDSSGNWNTWWALTDDDSGHKDVWVSVTAFTVGGQGKRISGLPNCY
jgi:hypothetical protein